MPGFAKHLFDLVTVQPKQRNTQHHHQQKRDQRGHVQRFVAGSGLRAEHLLQLDNQGVADAQLTQPAEAPLPQRCRTVQQRFDAQLVDAGHYQDSNQQQGRRHGFEHLDKGHRLGAFLVFINPNQADAGAGQQHRHRQANGAADQRRKLIIHLRQQQIGKGTAQDAKQNKRQIAANVPPGNDKTQCQQRDRKPGDKVDQRGLAANLQQAGVRQAQIGKAKPGRGAHGAEGNGHRVHHQRQQGNPQWVKT